MPQYLCKYCKISDVCRNKPENKSRTICTSCYKSNEESQTKICNKCGIIQNWTDFHKDSTGLFRCQSKCKKCTSIWDSQSLKVRKRFLKRMLGACRRSSQLRSANGKRDLKCTWTYEQMCAKLEQLQDRCAYSNLLMNFKSHSNWNCSPERIDNTIGYIDSNMTFICLEFQIGNGLQFSPELIEFICTIETAQHPRLAEIMSGEFEKKKFESHCSIGINDCINCRQFWDKHYNNTAGGRLRRLAGDSRKDSKRRKHPPSEADTKNILRILQEQEGKCKLTGHHLGFESGTPNCASLERIDVNLGYVTGNYCLIMQCMNSLNHSSSKSLANEPKEGSGGWTPEKVQFLRDSRKHIETTCPTLLQ